MTVPDIEHHRVDESLLFFDLVFVFAITGLSGVIQADPGGQGVLRAAILLSIMFWLWAGATVQASMRDLSGNAGRVVMMLITVVSLVLAVSIPAAFADHGLWFALAYWVGRTSLLVISRRAWRQMLPFWISACLTGPVLVAGSLLPAHPWREIVWAAVAVVEVLGLTFSARVMMLRYDVEHLTERFGLLILIAFGETLVSISDPLTEAVPGATQIATLGVSFTLIASMWWSYFHHTNRFVGLAVEHADDQPGAVRAILAHGHLVMVGAIILVAAGLHVASEDPLLPAEVETSLLLCGGTTLFMAVFAVIRGVRVRAWYRSRIAGCIAALGLLPFGQHLPQLAVVATLTVVTLGIAVWETLSPRSAGLPRDEDFLAS